MSIRSIPFDAISARDIESLRDREVREDRTLDFKRALSLDDRDARSEILKDIVAFANASGGTLVYGVEEGVNDQEGMIAALPGLVLIPDEIHRLIDNLLRDGVDERILGVLHRAIPRTDGRYYYVVRVPGSPLAPHMVTFGQHRARFFLRANTTSDPMDARQIKEAVLRINTAEDRALAFIDFRRHKLIEKAATRLSQAEADQTIGTQAILHVVPLFPHRGGWDFAEDAVRERLRRVPAFGYGTAYDSYRMTLEGMYSAYEDVRHVAFLRNGAVEFQQYGLLEQRSQRRTDGIRGWSIEQDVIRALDECAGLTGDGLLPLPLAVELSLSGVRDSKLLPNPVASGNERHIVEDLVITTPLLITAWGAETDSQLRSLFNEMYQAWGFARSINYSPSGDREWFSDQGRIEPPQRKYALAAG